MKKQDKILVMTAWGIWLRMIACVLIILMGWGVLGPLLMSNYDSDLGVVLGVVVFLLTPAFVGWILFGIYKSFKNKKK
jgi:hypothetical protein